MAKKVKTARKTAARKAKSAKKTAARTVKTARKTAARKVKTARKAVKKATRTVAKAARKAVARKKRKPSAAFMRPVTPSPVLAGIIGAKPVPRTVVTKQLWAYIKKHKLQDTTNRRMINANAPLAAVFGGRASVNMFEMTKLVGRHLK